MAASRLSAFAFSFFTLALGVALIVGNQLAFAVYNLWLNVTLPAAALLIAYSSLSIYRYFVQERSAREIRSAFSHYIHPDMVRVLAADPDRLVLGGEMRTMTLLFAAVNVTLPAAALLIAYSSLSIYRYFVQERSAREIRSAFSHYIHPDMVRVLAADPPRAAGSRRRDADDDAIVRRHSRLYHDRRALQERSPRGDPPDQPFPDAPT